MFDSRIIANMPIEKPRDLFKLFAIIIRNRKPRLQIVVVQQIPKEGG